MAVAVKEKFRRLWGDRCLLLLPFMGGCGSGRCIDMGWSSDCYVGSGLSFVHRTEVFFVSCVNSKL